MTESAWSEIDHQPDCLPMRWRQKYSHALTFQFFDSEHDLEEFSYEADVKWDGCINWRNSPHCMAHFCEPSDAQVLMNTFMRAWSVTKAVLPTALASAYKDIPDMEVVVG